MIFDKLLHLRSFTANQTDAARKVRRWSEARKQDPKLAEDVITLGGVLVAQPIENGEARPVDPAQLAYEAGRRDFALQLLTLMQFSPYDLSTMMKDTHDE